MPSLSAMVNSTASLIAAATSSLESPSFASVAVGPRFQHRSTLYRSARDVTPTISAQTRLRYAPLGLLRLVELGTDGRKPDIARYILDLCEGVVNVDVFLFGPAPGQTNAAKS